MAAGRATSVKKEAMQRFINLAEKYDIIAVADLHKVRSSQVQEMRKKLRTMADFLVLKGTLIRRAAEALEPKKPNILKFASSLSGPGLLIFSNLNPFSLMLFLEKNKVKVAARAGDVATNDVIISAGNTGLPPGPIISEFGQAKVPTRIEGGSIWVVKDTVVARKGEVISPRVASLLSKLGIKPLELGLTIRYAYDDGLVLGPDDLKLDLREYGDEIRKAFQYAANLAVEASYMVPETAPQILARAYRQALGLSLAAGYLTAENASHLLQRAYVNAKLIYEMVAAMSKKPIP